MSHTKQMVQLYRRRFEHYGHGSADQAIVGLGGQVFMRPSQDAVREFRPYFDNAPVYGHGPSLEDFSRETPLTVGSPQQVIERYAAMADDVSDCSGSCSSWTTPACRSGPCWSSSRSSVVRSCRSCGGSPRRAGRPRRTHRPTPHAWPALREAVR